LISTARPELLTPDEAIAYWDRRHQRESELRSGGDIGLDAAGNEIFYATRLGKLLEIIGDNPNPQEPPFVLDAGCGKGYFSRSLERCGFRVEGIDTSDSAIEFCRDQGSGNYAVSTLSGWRSPWLYDAVFSIDVLFHILDDAEWKASLENLASLVRLAGKLIVTDEYEDVRRQAGNYIVHRARPEYIGELGDAGFALREFRPYAFRANKIGFYVFVRAR
jgi:SAM-dependent methyltransferase